MDEFDRNFDDILQESIPPLPPEAVARAVGPWKQAMTRILWGFGLCNVTFAFFGLQYILPAIGVLLTLLGFRALRGENKWFRICYYFSVFNGLRMLLTVILNTTLFQNAFSGSTVNHILGCANLAITIAIYPCFWMALRTVLKKADLPSKAGGALALTVWNAVVSILAVLPLPQMWLTGIPLLVAYGMIIYSLVKLSATLTEAGYCITPTPTRIKDKFLVLAISLTVILGCLAGYLFFGRYPMDFAPTNSSTVTQSQQIKAHLTDLGFPAHILDDLTEEDLLSCKDALDVVVQGGNHRASRYSDERLGVIHIAVALPGPVEQWKIIHYFRWHESPAFRGTESIEVLNTTTNGLDWSSDGKISGQVLYDHAGQAYAAPFYSIEPSDHPLWNINTDVKAYAAFSLPREGENYRGYVSYTVTQVNPGCLIDAQFRYTHQDSPLQYPVRPAKDQAGYSLTFFTVQEQLLLDPNRQ